MVLTQGCGLKKIKTAEGHKREHAGFSRLTFPSKVHGLWQGRRFSEAEMEMRRRRTAALSCDGQSALPSPGPGSTLVAWSLSENIGVQCSPLGSPGWPEGAFLHMNS